MISLMHQEDSAHLHHHTRTSTSSIPQSPANDLSSLAFIIRQIIIVDTDIEVICIRQHNQFMSSASGMQSN